MKRIVLILAIISFFGRAMAQSLLETNALDKRQWTYQTSNGERIPYPARQGTDAPSKAQIKMCVDYAKKKYSWKDKESVRSDSAKWDDDGSFYPALILQLNAKNGYGAYAGSGRASCSIRNNKVFNMFYTTHDGEVMF
jgi:Ni/Co efflux regulator RcnB